MLKIIQDQKFISPTWKMVLICGEVYQNKLVVCLLEETTQMWSGHGQKFRVEGYKPKFITIKSDRSKFRIKFTSQSGCVRTGLVRKTPNTSWVVSCNNKHTIRDCTIWPTIADQRADLTFHLGDQIYADRVYWRWWRYLCSMDPDKWDLYIPDIEMEYHREYYETWEPLCEILSKTSNIMICDDHEIKDQAEVWDYLMAGVPSGQASWQSMKELPILVDLFMPQEETRKTQLEKFLFKIAFQVCQRLYLGLRLTNTESFDYFRNIGDVSVIMTERISQPFLGEPFITNFNRFRPHLKEKILWLGGLPPCPIRPNFWELLIYRHVSDISDDRYDQLYDLLFDSVKKSTFDHPRLILIGGDLHAGTMGWIVPDYGNKVAKFHISSPSGGFPSSYIPKDSIDSTPNYQIKVEDYRPSDPNAVLVRFQPFNSKHVFSCGSMADCWQNALSTGYTFWS